MSKQNTECLAEALHILIKGCSYKSLALGSQEAWIRKTEEVIDALKEIIYDYHEDVFGDDE